MNTIGGTVQLTDALRHQPVLQWYAERTADDERKESTGVYPARRAVLFGERYGGCMYVE